MVEARPAINGGPAFLTQIAFSVQGLRTPIKKIESTIYSNESLRMCALSEAKVAGY
jgi:hypothetical protein